MQDALDGTPVHERAHYIRDLKQDECCVRNMFLHLRRGQSTGTESTDLNQLYDAIALSQVP